MYLIQLACLLERLKSYDAKGSLGGSLGGSRSSTPRCVAKFSAERLAKGKATNGFTGFPVKLSKTDTYVFYKLSACSGYVALDCNDNDGIPYGVEKIIKAFGEWYDDCIRMNFKTFQPRHYCPLEKNLREKAGLPPCFERLEKNCYDPDFWEVEFDDNEEESTESDNEFIDDDDDEEESGDDDFINDDDESYEHPAKRKRCC